MQHIKESDIDVDQTTLQICCCVAILFIFLVLVWQSFVFMLIWNPHEAIIARRNTISIIVTNLLYLILTILSLSTCVHASTLNFLLLNLYMVCRLLNILFLIYRAKLCQAVNVVLNVNYFSRILPLFCILWHGFYLIFSTPWILTPEYMVCVGNRFSFQRSGFRVDLLVSIYFSIESVITLSVLSLFVIPLWSVWKTTTTSNLRTSHRQKRSKKVLVDALRYGVVLTLLNVVATKCSMFAVLYRQQSQVIWYLLFIDPVMNVLCTVLLLRKNRKYLTSSIGFSGRKTKRRKRSEQPVIIKPEDEVLPLKIKVDTYSAHNLHPSRPSTTISVVETTEKEKIPSIHTDDLYRYQIQTLKEKRVKDPKY